MKTLFRVMICVLIPLTIMCLLGAGCQTTKGLGKDVEKLGDKMQGK